MNHGPSSAPTVDGAPHHHATDVGQSTNEPSISANNSSSASLGTWQERARSKRKATLEKLFENLDHLVYVQLMALYYFDTSSLLLILRLVTNLTSLPATLALLPSPLRSTQRHSHTNLWTVLSVNVLAILIHAFFPLASAGEATRYDLHGHVVVDFVGQRALSGRWGRARLVFIDLLVLLIQGTSVGILLAIEHLERQPGKQGPATVTSGTAQRATAAANAAIAALMRRGEHWIGRSQATPIAAVSARTAQEEEGIEMRELSTPMVGEREQREAYTRPQSEPVQSEEPDTSERSILLPINTEVPAIRGESASENGLSPSEAQGRRDLEALYSGESTLVNIYFWQILRDQHYERRNRALAGTV